MDYAKRAAEMTNGVIRIRFNNGNPMDVVRSRLASAIDDLFNHHRRREGGMFLVSFTRWVDDPGGEYGG